MESSFHFNTIALIFGLLFFFGWWKLHRRRKQQQPFGWFSELSALAVEGPSFKEKMARWPDSFKALSLGFLLIAITDPHWKTEITRDPAAPPPETEEKPEEELFVPTRGIAAYLVLDQSGSMQQPVVGTLEDGKRIRTTRIDILRRMTREFVVGNPKLGLRGRPSDMLGLIAFARAPQVLVPLTLDHDLLLDKLAALKTVDSQERDGTAIGYAILKTANLITATRTFAQQLRGEGRPAYEIESTVIILVTDGLQTTHPEDRGHPIRTESLSSAAQFAKDNDIRLYIVNVEPALADFRFAAQRRELEQAAELTGGKFYLLDEKQGLVEIYRSIDQLEKSILPGEVLVQGKIEEKLQTGDEGKLYQRSSYAPTLIGIALSLLFLATLLEATWLRRAP